MLVRDFMTTKVVTITEDETLRTADLRFRQGRFRHLPVVRDGTVVGVVSDRDIRALRDLDVPDLPAVMERRRVRDVMRSPAIVASPGDPLEQAARLMYERKIGCLPVVEDGRLVGIVTTSDVFRAFVQVMGVTEPGTRLEIVLGTAPQDLARVGQVLADQRAGVLSMVTEPGPEPGTRTVVLRLDTINPTRVITALERAGLRVRAPLPS